MITIWDITNLEMETVGDEELPHRVEIKTQKGSVHGAGETMADALHAAFSTCGIWDKEARIEYGTLSSFIFWNFEISATWSDVIKALDN